MTPTFKGGRFKLPPLHLVPIEARMENLAISKMFSYNLSATFKEFSNKFTIAVNVLFHHWG